MADELPYQAEYAKSGRASCKNCRQTIDKNVLRLAVLIKSAKFDGKMTSWYHFDCFFERQRPKSEADIAHFDSLRWEDQEKIRERLKGLTNAPAVGGKRKGGKAASKANGDYGVEYAKSSRSTCRTCNEKIEKDAVRISKKSYESERAKMYGPQDEWHHMECFVKNRKDLSFFDSAEALPGFHALAKEDKDALRKNLPAETQAKVKQENGDAVDGGPSSAKKVKKEETEDEDKELLKKQNKKIFKYRDALEQNLSKSELQDLLEYNKQQVPSGISSMLDRLADDMAFGALEPCPECKNGQLVYRSGAGYQCTGNMSEWTKCTYVTQDPKRKPFKVPSEFADEYPFLKQYKYVPEKRYIPKLPPKKEIAAPLPTGATSKRVAAGPPLEGMTFVLGSKLERSKEEVKKLVESLGGKVGSRLSAKTAAVIATKEELDEMSSKMAKAQELGVQVVPESFLDEVKQEKERSAAALISNRNMATWGTNVEKRLGLEKNEPKTGIKYSKSVPEKLKLTLKGGGVVDPDSGLEDRAHVFKRKNELFSVVLGVVDIQSDRNSYYKLQVLEHDKKPKWWVFRSWGRVGTTIGGNKLESFDDKQDAIGVFEGLYEEKTGNLWKNHKQFVKQPGKLYPLDIDYGEAAEESKLSSEGSKSKLPKPVQELICAIFDVEAMKRALVEFELDLTKMPLGKISRNQIEKAYAVLSEVEQLLHQASDVPQAKFLDASNRFYTLIPHDFGMKTPPLLNNEELVKSKLEMLGSLLEIEVAYNLLKAGDAVKDKDPIDAHYEKLKATIDVLDKKSEEFKLIDAYVKNTHAPTHTQYTLDLQEVFKVERQGESKRYRPFAKLHNRKLLWHGSRVSNMAGIVSQGLRIAPPEAPVTGYMFGKGIYFADMVTKSANYCATSKSNPEGLMLLCEVALGNMHELTDADYIEKPPNRKNSVKGVGKTEPDSKETKKMDNGVEIPLGHPVKTNIKKTSLLYNEYIVYDVAQVNIKYLCKMKFNYKF